MKLLLLAAAAWVVGAQPVLERTLTGIPEGPAGVVFRSDGTALVVRTGGQKAIRFDPRTGARLDSQAADERFVGDTFSGSGEAASADGKRRLRVANGRVRITETAGRRLVSSVRVEGEAVAVARDFSRLALWTDAGMVLVDPRTGRRVAAIPHGDERGGTRAAARFSSDGRWLVTFAEFTPARVWGARTGKAAGTLGRHNTTAVALAPEQPLVALAIGDGTVELWRLP